MAKITKSETPAATLQDQLASKRAELIDTQRSHAAGELVNPRALGRIRKEIARIHTQINVPVTVTTDVPVADSKKKEETK